MAMNGRPLLASGGLKGHTSAPLVLRAQGLAPSRRTVTIRNGVRGQRDASESIKSKPHTPDWWSEFRKTAMAGVAASGLLPAGAAVADELKFDPASLSTVDISTQIANNPVEAAVSVSAVVLAVTFLATAVQTSGGKIRPLSNRRLVKFIKNTPKTLLVDIRRKKVVNRDGGPDWSQYGTKALGLSFTGHGKRRSTPDPYFGERFSKLRGLRKGTMVVLVDTDGSQAPAAARQILRTMGYKKIFYLQGGTNAWKAGDMPWKSRVSLKIPEYTLPELQIPELKLPEVKVSLPSVADLDLGKLSEAYNENAGAYNAGLLLSLVAVSLAVAVTEFDAVLEFVGLVAATQLLARRMLFAKDREETLRQFREIRDEKLALSEAGNDLKRLAATVFDKELAPKALSKSMKAAGLVKPSKAPIIQGVGSGAPAPVSSP